MITEADIGYPRKKYRPKIESTEAELRYPRKITEAEFWLMLHPVFTNPMIGFMVNSALPQLGPYQLGPYPWSIRPLL